MQMFVIVVRMVLRWLTIFKFPHPERIIGFNKSIQNSLKRFYFSKKTAASTLQSGDESPQIGVNAFHVVSVAFVTVVTHIVCSIIVHIRVAQIAVGAIYFGFRSFIDHLLNPPCTLILSYAKCLDLSGFARNHRHQIDVLTSLGLRLALNEPIKLIKLKNPFALLFTQGKIKEFFLTN